MGSIKVKRCKSSMSHRPRARLTKSRLESLKAEFISTFNQSGEQTALRQPNIVRQQMKKHIGEQRIHQEFRQSKFCGSVAQMALSRIAKADYPRLKRSKPRKPIVFKSPTSKLASLRLAPHLLHSSPSQQHAHIDLLISRPPLQGGRSQKRFKKSRQQHRSHSQKPCCILKCRGFSD